MGMGYCEGGRTTRRRDKIVIKPVEVKVFSAQKIWNEDNAEYVSTKKREWRERNREHIKEYNRRYYLANK
jgi:hypothetical protein